MLPQVSFLALEYVAMALLLLTSLSNPAQLDPASPTLLHHPTTLLRWAAALPATILLLPLLDTLELLSRAGAQPPALLARALDPDGFTNARQLVRTLCGSVPTCVVQSVVYAQVRPEGRWGLLQGPEGCGAHIGDWWLRFDDLIGALLPFDC